MLILTCYINKCKIYFLNFKEIKIFVAPRSIVGHKPTVPNVVLHVCHVPHAPVSSSLSSPINPTAYLGHIVLLPP